MVHEVDKPDTKENKDSLRSETKSCKERCMEYLHKEKHQRPQKQWRLMHKHAPVVHLLMSYLLII